MIVVEVPGGDRAPNSFERHTLQSASKIISRSATIWWWWVFSPELKWYNSIKPKAFCAAVQNRRRRIIIIRRRSLREMRQLLIMVCLFVTRWNDRVAASANELQGRCAWSSIREKTSLSPEGAGLHSQKKKKKKKRHYLSLLHWPILLCVPCDSVLCAETQSISADTSLARFPFSIDPFDLRLEMR